MNQHENQQIGKDMTDAQKEKLRELFEPKYGRKLTEQELFEIHFNLKALFKAITQIETENNS